MKSLNADKKQKVVIILGPPRSGTSTVGGLLSILGVDMGRVRPPSPKNPKGFFEDRDFLNLIDRIFEAADTHSSGWKPPPIEKILDQKGIFDNQIKELLKKRSKETTSSIWGWKVIGTSLAIDLFLPHLPDPYFIVINRNILDCASSSVEYTKEKEKLSLSEAKNLIHLYQKYIKVFLERHPELPRTFVSFDHLLKNPQGETRRLASFLNLDVTAKQLQQAQKFIIPRDRIGREKKRIQVKNFLSKSLPRYLNKVIHNPLIVFKRLSGLVHPKKKKS